MQCLRTQADLDALVTRLSRTRRIAVDLETQGVDALVDKILLIAFSWMEDEEVQTAVVRRHGLDLGGLKKLIESGHALWLAHSAKFEWKFFYAQEGITFRRLYCSLLGDKMVCDGKYQSWGLGDLTLRRLGITMENKKELQRSFIGMPADSEFSDEQIAYAGDDTACLLPIFEQQHAEMEQIGVVDLMKTELALLPVLARMELEGLVIDDEKWRQHLIKLETDRAPLVPQVKDALTPVLLEKFDNLWKSKNAEYVARVKEMAPAQLAIYREGPVKNKTNKERSAFDDRWIGVIRDGAPVEDISLLPATVRHAIHRAFNEEAAGAKPLHEEMKVLWEKLRKLQDEGINLNSPMQIIEAYRLFDIEIGIDGVEDYQIERDDDGEDKNSTDVEALEGAIAFMDQNPRYTKLKAATQVFLTLKKIEKQLSTYGAGMLDMRHPLTGRIHTDYQQIGSKGGRMAARKPNVLNIPNRGEQTVYRTFFIAPPKHKLVKADFAAIELRISTEMTQDPIMLDAFRTGKDMHSRTAGLVFGIPYEEMIARKDTDQAIKDKRSLAKIVNFGLAYGMTKYGLSTQAHVPLSEADDFIRRYEEEFVVLCQKLHELGNLGLNRGYAESLAGRRLYFHKPRENDPEFKKKCRSIYRRARNGPIQSLNADITKQAGVWLAADLKAYSDRPLGLWTRGIVAAEDVDGNLTEAIELSLPAGDIASPINFVHDEIVVVAPEGKADEIGDLVRRRMIEAGEKWIKSIPVEVDVHIANNWKG